MGVFSYLFHQHESDEEKIAKIKQRLALLEIDEVEDVKPEQVDQSNLSLHCTGTITKVITTKKRFIINNKFRYDAEKPENWQVGNVVSFILYKADNDDVGQVRNVRAHDAWTNGNDTETHVLEKKPILTRNIVAQVTARDKRQIHVSPYDFSFSLDNVKSSFVPIVGDWIVMDSRSEFSDESSELIGEILSVTEIFPLRSKVQIGYVRKFSAQTQQGVIDNDVYFDTHACQNAYTPCVGDKIISEVIESEQVGCQWRAISVIEHAHQQTVAHELDELIENKRGVCVDDALKFEMTALKETKCLDVTVRNESDVSVKILRSQFNNMQNVSQISVISPSMHRAITLNPSETVTYKFQAVARYPGRTRELFVFHFEQFKIGRWIEINCTAGVSNLTDVGSTKNRTGNFARARNSCRDTWTDVIPGVRANRLAPFNRAGRMPLYNVPEKFWKVFMANDTRRSLDELQFLLGKIDPVLVHNLTFSNYTCRFSTLLYLDEIQQHVAVHSYDMPGVRFITCKDYLLLKIENLHERRPSLIIGDKVIATETMSNSNKRFEGIIHDVKSDAICLKFNANFHGGYLGAEYDVSFELSRMSIRRHHQALEFAHNNLGEEILFPKIVREKQPQINARKSSISWLNKNLNEYQKEAIENILAGVARPMPYVIFGPPGTGKTVTLVETALQILRMLPGSRLIIATPSNSAANLIVERLLDSAVLKPGDLIRIVSFNAIQKGTIPERILPYCASPELDKKDDSLSANYARLGVKARALGRHRITVSTCSSLFNLHTMNFKPGHFTHVLVDEAGQATEPEIMIPLSLIDKNSGQIILAGDPLQLGPVVLSIHAKHFGLEESYLVRLTNRFPYMRDLTGFPNTNGFDPRVVSRLRINYRSVPEILALPNRLFYNSELIAHVSQTDGPSAAILTNVKDILPARANGPPAVIFHNVNGINLRVADCPSWYNPYESAQVFFYVQKLFASGYTCDDIGIITPYVEQVKQIRNILAPLYDQLPKIASVEEFQGQERNIIILSTVRSCFDSVQEDLKYSLGFISSPQRMNVSLTRAKALLIIVGDAGTLVNDNCWRSVIGYCKENGGYVA